MTCKKGLLTIVKLIVSKFYKIKVYGVHRNDLSTLNMWFYSHSNTAHLVFSVGKCVHLFTLKARILAKVTTTLVKYVNWSIHL
jgi:hypothetical protein